MPAAQLPIASILLADDHPFVRKGLRALLESETGFSVVGEASDGEDALRQTRTLSPDVVVMDVTMPKVNGIEATRRILAETPRTRIVTLSMHAEKALVDDMVKAGASAYVAKQSAPEDLVQAIHAVLRGERFLSTPMIQAPVSGLGESIEGRKGTLDTERPASGPPVAQAKLYRPVVPADFVSRPHVYERLDNGRSLPLTLVSAPAGYGKTLATTGWLEQSGAPSAWLTLDERDSDVRQFVTYFIAAVRRLAPEACPETSTLVSAPDMPGAGAVAAGLCRDLENLGRSLVVVLDDYHEIAPDSPVHELLHQLLRRPPNGVHFVIITRRDPAIPLCLLRSRGQVSEIRMRDLRFDSADARALLGRALGFAVSEAALANLDRELEGWAAGLRLVALAAVESKEPNVFLEQLRGGVQHAQSYLVQEVMARQAPPVREWLLKSAILERFSAPLAEAVCDGKDGAGREALKGEAFVRTVNDENLFVVPLDAHGGWFRYHQLFQELLVTELKRQYSQDIVADLHVRASAWLQSQGWADEAAAHARAAAALSRGRVPVAPPPPHAIVTPHDARPAAGPRNDVVRPGGLFPGDELSNRELDVVELLAERLQNKEIADRLAIAPQTVNYHLKHIYGKLGVQTRREAARRAFDLGLIRSQPLTLPRS